MNSIDFDNMPSPAPTYSSTFDSQDISDIPRHTGFTIMPHNDMSYRQSPEHEPSAPTFQLWEKTPLDDKEAIRTRPDYLDSNHPHFANSIESDIAPVLPARSRIPAKRILIPWVLFAIFFLISMWYTSILFGARFLSIVRPTPSSITAQEINIYIHGELVQGTVSVSTKSFAAPSSTATSIVQAPMPTTSLPSGNDRIPDIGNQLGRISSDVGSSITSAPTGFITMTRGIL
jgi:hypothetical protein